MGVVTEKLQLLVEMSTKGAASEAKALEGAEAGAAKQSGLLQGGLQKLGFQGATTGDALKGAAVAGGALAATGLGAFLEQGVEKFASLTSEVRGFQRVAGTSAEDSSKLVFAMRDLGIAPDVAAASVGRLETRLGTGKANLEQFGIATKDASGKTLDATTIIANVAEAYQNADTQSERAAIGNEAFGKSWQKMAPLLGKSKQDLQELYAEAGKDHQIFSQTDLENGRKLALATTQLKDAVTGLEVEAGSALAPAVAQGAGAITDTIHTADDATASLGGLGGAMKIVEGNANPLVFGAHGVSAATELMSGHFADAGKNALEALPGIGGYASALFGTDEATNKLADTQQRAKDAATNLANAQAEHGRNSKEAKAAEADLASATRDLDGMERGLSQSLQDVNDKLQTHTDKVYAAAQADLVEGGTKLGLENALAGVNTKFDAYNQVLVANFAAQDGSKQATEAAAQAHRDLVDQVRQAITAAGQKAVADNADKSATEQKSAANKAMRETLIELEAEYPGLRDLVQGYVGDLDKIPLSKGTSVTVDASQAFGVLSALNSSLDAINRSVDVVINVVKREIDSGG